MSYRLKNGDNVLDISPESAQTLDFSYSNDGSIHILQDNISYKAEDIAINAMDKTASITLNGREYTFTIEDKLDQLIDKMGLSTVDNAISKEIKAPMPGLILPFNVMEAVLSMAFIAISSAL